MKGSATSIKITINQAWNNFKEFTCVSLPPRRQDIPAFEGNALELHCWSQSSIGELKFNVSVAFSPPFLATTSIIYRNTKGALIAGFSNAVNCMSLIEAVIAIRNTCLLVNRFVNHLITIRSDEKEVINTISSPNSALNWGPRVIVKDIQKITANRNIYSSR